MLNSIYTGKNDAWLIDQLIKLHWLSRHPDDAKPIIVDTTYGSGHFWDGFDYDVVKLDRDPERAKSVQADYNYLPFVDNSINIITWDPPHIADKGKPRDKFMSKQYSIVWQADSLAKQVYNFVVSAKTMLRPDGIIICKISDQVQIGRKYWQHYNFMETCFAQGLTVCDLIIKVRPAPMAQPYDYQIHARQQHSFFIIARKGKC